MFCLSLVIYDDPVFFMQKSMLYLKWTSKTSALVHIKNAAVTMFARENAERFLFKNDEYVKYFEIASTYTFRVVVVAKCFGRIFLCFEHGFLMGVFLSSIENNFSNLIF